MVCCCNTIGNIFRLVIVGGCIFALGMQFLNIYSCDFFSSTGDAINVGIWFQGQNGECNIEDGFYAAEEDGLVAVARSSLLISMLCGTAALVMVLFEWLFCEICCAGCLEGCAFVGAWACGLGVYLIFGIEACGDLKEDFAGDDTLSNLGSSIIPDGIPTGSQCEWGQGATYNLVACVAYFGCGILLCFAPQPKPICRDK